MKKSEVILDAVLEDRGIRKGWVDESKQAVLGAMEVYASMVKELKWIKVKDLKPVDGREYLISDGEDVTVSLWYDDTKWGGYEDYSYYCEKPHPPQQNNNGILMLGREDLVKFKKNLSIHEITINDFKSSSVSRDEIRKAEKITFVDGEISKVLKSRY